MSQSIPLSQVAFALVDDDDYASLSSYKWFLSGTGYAVGLMPVEGRSQLVYMHRLILKAGSDQQVDHINGDVLDNQRQNLRLATPRQNGHNRRVSPISSTQLKGVSWHKRRNKYQARIQLQGLRCHLGYFLDAETAALAYDSAARRLFGAFAHVNYPERETPRSTGVLVAQRLEQRGLQWS